MRFEMKDCGGCRTCELACSFRFSGEFCYDYSAIKIIVNDTGDGYFVELIGDPTAPFRCDACVDIDEPMCVQFCHHKDQLTEFIAEYTKSVLHREGSVSD